MELTTANRGKTGMKCDCILRDSRKHFLTTVHDHLLALWKSCKQSRKPVELLDIAFSWHNTMYTGIMQSSELLQTKHSYLILQLHCAKQHT